VLGKIDVPGTPKRVFVAFPAVYFDSLLNDDVMAVS
jgi:hypothetical protein